MPKLEPNPILNITGNKNTASVIQTLRPSHPGQPAIVVMKSKFPNKSSTMTLQQINLEQKVHIVFSETPCCYLLFFSRIEIIITYLYFKILSITRQKIPTVQQ